MGLTDTEMELNNLKHENLELKLSAIRKDVSSLKIDLHRHLDLILEQTSATNGSVAKALERIYNLERQDNKAKIEKLTKEFEESKKTLSFWYTVSKNKWIIALLVFVMYAFTIQELRDVVLTLLRIK